MPVPDAATPPPAVAMSNGSANSEFAGANNVIGKRKRSTSSAESMRQSPQKQKDTTGGLSDEEKSWRRKNAINTISDHLLAVLKEYDPTPSVLSFSLSSVASANSSGSPPSLKRTKLSRAVPNTIADRLTAGSYASLSALLEDVSAVCQFITNSAPFGPRANGVLSGASGWDNVNSDAARVIYYERFVKDLVNRERKREANVLDLVDEVDKENQMEDVDGTDKIALTVMAHHGPLFSSLQKPQPIPLPSVASSRSNSTSGSPKSPISSAPSSVPDSPPKMKTENVSVVMPFVESVLPPLVSTVKAVAPASVVSKNEGGSRAKAPTIGEAFPPVQALPPLQPVKIEKPTYGLKWGGEIGLGGTATDTLAERKSEYQSHWLQYWNVAKPDMTRIPPDRWIHGIGLPPDFVAAYTSFAPTRDESVGKTPASMSNAIWWERRGGRIFRKMFAEDPLLGNMFPEKTRTTTVAVGRPTPAKELMELDEKELEEAVANFEESLTIDDRLLNGEVTKDTALTDDCEEMSPDAVLAEVSSLLVRLQSAQYSRFATTLKPGESPADPTEEEYKAYRRLSDRLSFLISTLPPHVIATIDGHPDSELSLSKRIPLSTGLPTFRGTLPNEDTSAPKQPGPQVQAAAMNAMNAAAGISPVAPMARQVTPGQQIRVQGAPHLTVNSVPTPQQYQHQQYHTNQSPPHHYPTPMMHRTPSYAGHTPQPQYAYQQSPVPQQPRSRGNVPPPQGLAAVGVGGGYASPGGVRYSQRTRR